MGNFYVNFTVRSSDQAAVIKALAGRSAFVTPASNGAIVVFDEAADSQDTDEIGQLGAHLSQTVRCPVLAILNHDDDILWYVLFEAGRLADEYDSSPGYFEGPQRAPEGGDAGKLCAAFSSPHVAEVEKILRKSSLDEDGYVFAYERHADLVRALNLPDYAVAFGFGSISQGEVPQGLAKGDLVRVS